MAGKRLPDLDALLTALGNVRRRRVLHALMVGETVDLAPRAAGGDGAVAPGAPNAVGRRRARLPELEAYGYVEWNRPVGEFRRGPNFAEIEPLLEL